MSLSNPGLNTILSDLIAGSLLKGEQQRQLESWVLQDQLRARAFGVSSENVEAVIQARSQLLPSIYPAVKTLCQQRLQLPTASLLELLWNLWLPLALKLVADRQKLERPLIQGIVGTQGTGKSTLSDILASILNHLGCPTLSFSLDDLYKTYAERQRLRQHDPRLIWRGPPGTHDIQLGTQVVDQLRSPNRSSSISIPRFDKSAWQGAGDRTTPEVVEAIEIVLFEGWFVGVQPIDQTLFATAPPPILTTADQAFAVDMNARLQDYLPLWQRLDHLILLDLLDYRLSQQWRRQAEHQAIAAGKSGMSDTDLNQFVQYFWRTLHPDLFLKPGAKSSERVDLVIEINPDHAPGLVYRPSDRLNPDTGAAL